MKKLYQKSELCFSLLWIGAYIVLLSAADAISSQTQTEKLLTAPLCVALTGFLLIWLKKERLTAFYGLKKAHFPHKIYLFFLPLVLLVSVNLWGGVLIDLSPAETALYIISMLCVGFLEEVIFRGFLFKALCKESVQRAIIVSSLAFGFGHIINLFNGSGMDLLANVGQVVSAVAFGFLFVTIFMKSGSLLICIAAHSSINALSAFAVSPSPIWDLIAALILTVIAASYALIFWKNPPQKQ